jgi:hypothetical protein
MVKCLPIGSRLTRSATDTHLIEHHGVVEDFDDRGNFTVRCDDGVLLANCDQKFVRVVREDDQECVHNVSSDRNHEEDRNREDDDLTTTVKLATQFITVLSETTRDLATNQPRLVASKRATKARGLKKLDLKKIAAACNAGKDPHDQVVQGLNGGVHRVAVGGGEVACAPSKVTNAAKKGDERMKPCASVRCDVAVASVDSRILGGIRKTRSAVIETMGPKGVLPPVAPSLISSGKRKRTCRAFNNTTSESTRAKKIRRECA